MNPNHKKRMKLLDIIAFSIRSFRNRRSRVALTVLGVAVGIAVITFLVSIGYGLQRTILDRITTAEALLTLDVTSPDEGSVALDRDSIDYLSEVQHVEAVSPRAGRSAAMSLGRLSSETTIYFVDDQYLRLAGLAVEEGDGFNNENPEGVIVTQTVAQLLGYEPQDILGEEINFTFTLGAIDTSSEISDIEEPDSFVEINDVAETEIEQRLMVVGYFEETQLENEVYALFGSIDETINSYESIKVQVDDQRNIDIVRENIAMRGFVVAALSDLAEQANQVFTVLQVILAIFGVFSLIVAAIGLLNTMTISLLERTNEIGIMRAIGASRNDVQKLFLIESSLIGFVGGLAGLFLGLIAGGLFNFILNIVARALGGQPVDVFATPFWFVLLVLVLSVMVGFISGFFPSRRAARLNTLSALRYK